MITNDLDENIIKYDCDTADKINIIIYKSLMYS